MSVALAATHLHRALPIRPCPLSSIRFPSERQMRTPSEASAMPEFLPSRILLKYRFLDGNCSLRSLSFLGFLDVLIGFFSFLLFSFLFVSLSISTPAVSRKRIVHRVSRCSISFHTLLYCLNSTVLSSLVCSFSPAQIFLFVGGMTHYGASKITSHSSSSQANDPSTQTPQPDTLSW